jgi:hypothetical protein
MSYPDDFNSLTSKKPLAIGIAYESLSPRSLGPRRKPR